MFEFAVCAQRRTPSRSRLLIATRLVACLVAGMLIGVGAAETVLAQDDPVGDVPLVTKTFAILNARIVQAPGEVLERSTVVMRNGLITAVGADAAVPYDAHIIEGDSLTVYAGFIDGLSHVAIPETETERNSDPVNSADPPPERAGIQPNRSARDRIDPSHESVGALRAVGFTVAHVVPRGRMLPGSGSIVLLVGEEAPDMVLRPDVSQFMQFTGASGVYPATPMGVMAKLRQLFREAERSAGMGRLYSENPAGIERPSYDPILEAFHPVISGEKPLFILADGTDGAMEVHRAIQLRDELGFSLVLAGLNQGFYAMRALQEADVPLFVTLALPAESDTANGDPDSADVDTVRAITPQEPATFFVSDLRTRSFEDVEREGENLSARKALFRERYVATAAELHDAGLRFGFTTVNVEPKDIRKNIREMMAAGLSEDAVLAALTIDGARLLGIDRSVGTIEPGKLANLVVTKGSYFGDQEDVIRHVFVDGHKYDVEADDDGDEDGDEDADEDVEADRDDSDVSRIAGTWNLEVETPDGPMEAVLNLSVSGEMISGEVTSSEMIRPANLQDPDFIGGRLSFDVEASEYGLITARLDVTGSSLTGTIDVPGVGVLDVIGTKVP
jgi:imidazolonepropionase-like amidohydrolase